MEKMSTFNLLTDSFLPCTFVGGGVKALGIRDVLKYAHEIRELADDSPAVNLGALRLLIVVVINAQLQDEAADLNGKFSEALDGKLSHLQKFLFLTGDEKPFFQNRTIDFDGRSASYLVPRMSSGTNINHFSHDYDGKCKVCLPCCARGLIQIPIFPTKGKTGSLTTINSGKGCPLFIVPHGRNLFQTIALNLPAEPQPEYDRPAWEGTTLGRTNGPIGVQEGLTWQNRMARIGLPAPGQCDCCGTAETPVVLLGRTIKGRARGAESQRSWKDPHAVISDAKPQLPPDPQSQRTAFVGYWRAIFRSVLLRMRGSTIFEEGRFIGTALHTDGDAKIFIEQSQRLTINSMSSECLDTFFAALDFADMLFEKVRELQLETEFFARYKRERRAKDKKEFKQTNLKSEFAKAHWDFESQVKNEFGIFITGMSDNHVSAGVKLAEWKKRLRGLAENALYPKGPYRNELEKLEGQMRFVSNLNKVCGVHESRS